MLEKLYKNCSMTIMVLSLVFLFTSCASAPKTINPELPITPAKRQLSDLNPDVKYAIADAYDPWEGFNRNVYNFNYHFDKYFFLPVVSGYKFIMPDFLENFVSNFFDNLGELKNFTNSFLQGKWESGGTTLGRFVINSTVGFGGIADVATDIGIPRQNEDLGQTLGFYGLGAGPYLVLPVFGPSSLRDTVGLAGDTLTRAGVEAWIDPLNGADHEDAIWIGFNTIEAIDARKRQSFRYYESGSPFEYELIRFLYLTKRKIEIGDKENSAEE